MAIRILAAHEAAKIAAGEVIERPASVVKELLENALDAGATRVAVEVREGGLALIRVADDGRGIEPGELRLAFERHATSKVASEDDLWRIATLGFRGEALPSIAAAGEVELLTRVAGNDVGARIRLRDGAIVDEGSGAAAPGTVFTVRRLFAAQPARLKFLRTPGGESTQVASVVTHYAMAYPEVRFTLVVEGRTTLQTAGTGDLRDAVAAVYGPDVAAAAISVEAPAAAEGGRSLRGVAVAPSLHRASRAYIGLFINRRWVKNRPLTFAVEEAYQGMLPVGRRPIAVLDVRLPADEVDVNVHPTKAEVRLRGEREVFAMLQRAVRGALSAHSPVPAASAGVWRGFGDGAASLSSYPVAQPAPAAARVPDFLAQAPVGLRQPAGVQVALPAPSGERIAVAADGNGRAAAAATEAALPMLRAVGQVGNTYVVAEGPEGMYLVDQHAAHERVLYERFLASVDAGRPDVQGLLAPLTLEPGAAQRALIAEHAPSLARAGFDIEPFGDAAYIVRAVPASVARRAETGDIGHRICELLDRIARDDGGDDSAHRVAASLACHAAVRAGMAMSDGEQRELLRQLEEAEAPRTCPHGRPTMLHLAADALAREFRRR